MLVRANAIRKPDLLLLSHCFPEATGNAARARAWQLLKLASATHRVWLAAIADGDVMLEHWRRAGTLADRIVLETTRPLASLAGLACSFIDPTARERWASSNVLTDTIRRWQSDARFDAVLCTHRSLWSHIDAVPSAMTLCDLSSPRPLGDRARSAVARHERSIAERADIVMTSAGTEAHRLAGAASRRLIVPEGIDLTHFGDEHIQRTINEPGDASRARLVIGGHGGSRDAAFRGWFRDRVMPAVREAVPDVELASARSRHDARWASVIVCPDSEPEAGRWPILTAMAISKPVVTSAEAATGWNVKHGEHLLLSRDKDDWARNCIDSLRSAALRADLTRRARAFLERHCLVERTGRDLLLTLEAGRRLSTLAQAA